MKLYYFAGACSHAPHIALREIEARFELVAVDPTTKKTASGQDYRRINPNGYVPALELDNGSVLTEAVAILQYIADLAPNSGLAPARDSFERYQLQSWLNFVATEIHKGFGPLWGSDTPDSYKTVVKKKLDDRFNYLDQQLAKHQWLYGDHYTIADIYLYVVTGWAAHFNIDLQRWPALAAWRERIAARPAVQAAAQAEKSKK